jgi:hypothetical protein
MNKKCSLEPNKNRYNTQKDADLIALINNKNLRSYYCLTCKGWHLTSNID